MSSGTFVDKLLGMHQTGGGKMRKKRGGFFADSWTCNQCVKTSSLTPPSIKETPVEKADSAPISHLKPVNGEHKAPEKLEEPVESEMTGGRKKGMKASVYKKYLENMTKEKLHKIAASKGVKITKKKNGVTTYVKKDTIVKKLCDFKYKK